MKKIYIKNHNKKVTAIIFTLSFLFISLSLMVSTARAESKPKVIIGGTVEAEVRFHSRKFDDPGKEKITESDVLVSTVEIGVDAEINPSVKGYVSLLWEEDETEEVRDFLDEGILTFSNPDKYPYYLKIGKMYLPFGSFDTSFVTDPMTLELGEINQTALELGFNKEYTSMAVGLFNSDIDKKGKDNEINSFYGQLAFNYSQGPATITTSASYISNIADTDGVESFFTDSNTDDFLQVNDYIQGIGLFLKAETDTLVFLAEYIAAIDKIEEKGLLEKSVKPKSYNFEIGLKSLKKALLAVKYEKSNDIEYLNPDLPEKRYGLVISYSLFEYAKLSLEYINEKYIGEGAKGKNNCFTAQLAIEF